MQLVTLLAAMQILVSGGDPAEEARVLDAYRRVPECLRKPAEDVELRVLPGSLNAEYSPYQELDLKRPIGAPPPPVQHYIGIYDRLLVDAERLEDEAAAEPFFCARPGDLEPLLGNLDRVMLHEVVHSWHYDLRGGGVRLDVEEFLAIRFRAAYDAWAEDPERIRIHDEYLAAQERVAARIEEGKEPAQSDLEQVCALQDELAHKYGRMPSRFPGDFHAFSQANGAEYLAMAIETLAYEPEIFCKTWSAEEIAWLKDYLGRCLAKLKKRAACYDAMPAQGEGTKSPAGAGIRRD